MPAGFGLRGTLGTVSIVISVVDRATRKMNNIGKGLRQMNVSVSAMSQAFRGIGMALTMMMTMATAAADAFIKETLAIEEPLTKLTAVAADSGRTFAEWGALAIKVADEAKVSIIDAGKAMYWTASAGVTEAKAVEALTVEAGMMARIHGVDVTKAISILVPTMKTYDVAMTDASQTANMLNAAVGRSLLTFDALGDTLKYSAPLAKMVNWEFEGLMSGIMAMANAGIRGSKAGTALRAVITRLAAPAAAARKTMAELGLEFFELKEGGQAVKEEMEKAGRAFDKLQDEVSDTETAIEDLRRTMNRQSLEERKLRHEISVIRLRAAAENRELTDDEVRGIERIELAMEGMAYEREANAIAEEEASIARDDLVKSAKEMREMEEEAAEELKTYMGEMMELPELLEQVATAFKPLTEQQRIQSAETLVGKRGLAGFIAMLKVADPTLFTTTGIIESGKVAIEDMGIATGETTMTLAQLRDMLAKEKIALDESFTAMGFKIAEQSLLTDSIEAGNIAQADQLNALIGNKEAMEEVIDTIAMTQKVIRMLSLGFIKFIGVLGKTKAAMLLMLGPLLMFAGPIIAMVIVGFIRLIKYTIAMIAKNILHAKSLWGVTAATLASKAATLLLIGAVFAVMGAIAVIIIEVKKMSDEFTSAFDESVEGIRNMESEFDDALGPHSVAGSFNMAVTESVGHLSRLDDRLMETGRNIRDFGRTVGIEAIPTAVERGVDTAILALDRFEDNFTDMQKRIYKAAGVPLGAPLSAVQRALQYTGKKGGPFGLTTYYTGEYGRPVQEIRLKIELAPGIWQILSWDEASKILGEKILDRVRGSIP